MSAWDEVRRLEPMERLWLGLQLTGWVVLVWFLILAA